MSSEVEGQCEAKSLSRPAIERGTNLFNISSGIMAPEVEGQCEVETLDCVCFHQTPLAPAQ